ncbi:MAG TPA: hypothetical protein VNI52_09330 [Sphingobacteriaceae bacterium]|nr:hypothetical protein [Sphingobacteriaceae bacterium]
MKKLTNLISPFIMMLVPVFLVIGLLILNRGTEMPAKKIEAGTSFQAPSFKVMVRSILSV